MRNNAVINFTEYPEKVTLDNGTSFIYNNGSLTVNLSIDPPRVPNDPDRVPTTLHGEIIIESSESLGGDLNQNITARVTALSDKAIKITLTSEGSN